MNSNKALVLVICDVFVNIGAAVNVVPVSSNGSIDLPLELFAYTCIMYVIPGKRLDKVAVSEGDTVVIYVVMVLEYVAEI